MNTARRPGHRGWPRRPVARRRIRRFGAGLAALTAAGVLVAGCASFPASSPSFDEQPSLVPNVATLVTPSPQPGSSTGTASSTDAPSGSSGSPASTTQQAADPCGPSAPPVIATCLDQPWGLAPLPDGQSALVGERTTGKIFRVAPHQKPELVTTVTDLDTSGGGGLLGIALSPYYVEDHLIYAYVTTSTDNRILRIAPGERPEAIFTGIPAGSELGGGPIAFGDDGMLYVATGDAGRSKAANDENDPNDQNDQNDQDNQSNPNDPNNPNNPNDPDGRDDQNNQGEDADSLAGAVLRLDAFGKPADDNPGGGAVYATGLTHPTGICPLPGGRIGVLDHRGTGDALIPVTSDADYDHLASGETLWTYQSGDGGGVDCAVSDATLLATSLDAEKVTSIQMRPSGGFTGAPQDLISQEYGRLRTIVTGPGGLVWLTTANTDGHGNPGPSDDRVIVLPAGGGGGGPGID